MKVVLLGAVLLLAACGGSSAASSHTLSGTLTLPRGDCITQSTGSSTLTGTGGYTDIDVGTAVVVRDEAGTVKATGHLAYQTGHQGCVWDFKVTDVPDAKFYQVEVSHRGAVSYSRSDLDKANWIVSLSIG